MRVALVHDYLNQWGGAERVLEVFAEMFPEAPIFTLLYDGARTLGKFKGKKIITSFLDRPLVRKNHRPFIPLMPLAMRFLKVPADFDLVISSSASFAKGVRYGKQTKHLSYIHTPLRYAWEQETYLQPITNNLQLKTYKPILNWLKRWDYLAAQRPEVLIANSEFIAEKIGQYYKRDAIVIYPPVDLSVFYPKTTTHYSPPTTNYFLAIGRFLHYKKFDLVIHAFQELGLPLKIVGQGPEEEKLKKLGSDSKNIEFLPFVKTDGELRTLYQNARAVIFPQVEDFGLVAAEAIACGTPVIAYGAGGSKEIVNLHSGVLFPKQTKEWLVKAVHEFIEKEADFKSEIVSEQAKKFSKENFIREIRKVIERYF